MHVTYCALIITATSSNWRRGWTSRLSMAFDTEVCKFRTGVVGRFFSVCISEVYVMKLHSLAHIVKDTRRVEDKSVLDSSIHERFNIHITRGYRGLSTRRATFVQERAMLMEREQISKQPR